MPLGPEDMSLEGGAALHPRSIGRVRSFYGNFLVVLKATAYLLSLGRENIPEAARAAVLNANYLMQRLKEKYHVHSFDSEPGTPVSGKLASQKRCMHEFVVSLKELKESRGVSATDMAKALQDLGIHPPTVYFPLIVQEALMIEPTETESKETLDAAADAFLSLYERALKEPETLNAAPLNTVIGRPDDVKAARQPVLRWRADNR
jgi:glycine dehydrogenase subunit 2